MSNVLKKRNSSGGLVAWRIENKESVSVPTDEMSKLHTGDSYLFLYSKNPGGPWNIHFWLGSETSQDESGIAAYKAVELDDSLNGSAVQYRECQGSESELFLSYFKGTGLTYLEGGVESGFNHVERDEYPTRLLQVKGKRVVRVSPVPVKSTSLNDGDVFILDKGLTLYLFAGPKANLMEKARGAEYIRSIRNNERSGRPIIVLMDDEPENEDFWSTLDGNIQDELRPAPEDTEAEKSAVKSTKLLNVSNASGSLEVTDVTPEDGTLTRSLLTEDDVMLLDTGTQIFVWIGSGASDEERQNGMQTATTYLSNNNRPSTTGVTRIVQHGEPTVFKSHFNTWTPPRVLSFGENVHEVEKDDASHVDVTSMLVKNLEAEETVDDGSGDVKVWRIENMEKVEVPEEKIGQFYGGDSYIVLYTYSLESNHEDYIAYFWQGRNSSTDEKGAAALLTVELDNKETGGRAVQVRVVQGKEPAHFRRIFKGKMVVHSGGKASGFKNTEEEDSYDTDGVSLYHVKGTNGLNTCASQVDEKAANLNSGDCFILVTTDGNFVWNGTASSDDEQHVATTIATKILNPKDSDVTQVAEGEETPEFWGYLGGKATYPSVKGGDVLPQAPRLFECSTATGAFKCEEITNYAQDDLNSDDVYLLDTYSSIYLWIGKGALDSEKTNAREVASQYIEASADGRTDDTPVVTVHCGAEPEMFTCNFLAWDPKFFENQIFLDPYEARLAKIKAEKEAAAAAVLSEEEGIEPPEEESEEEEEVPEQKYYTYEELVAGNCPGVGMAEKEKALTDEDFVKVFGIPKAEFFGLGKWKQQSKKKQVKLF